MTEPVDLRRVVLDTADDLELVEGALARACRYSTEDNAELRMALLELRGLRTKLYTEGRR